jgi:hypothetical protein
MKRVFLKKLRVQRSAITTIVVAAVIICIVGLLILPQVDPDNFTLNSVPSYTNLLAHGQGSTPSAIAYAHQIYVANSDSAAFVIWMVVSNRESRSARASFVTLRC